MSLYKISQTCLEDDENGFLLSHWSSNKNESTKPQDEEGPELVPCTTRDEIAHDDTIKEITKLKHDGLPDKGSIEESEHPNEDPISGEDPITNEYGAAPNGSFEEGRLSEDFMEPIEPSSLASYDSDEERTAVQDETLAVTVPSSHPRSDNDREEKNVIHGVLADETRKNMMENAVSAINVKAEEASTPRRKIWTPIVVVLVAVAAAVGSAVGVTLSRRNQNDTLPTAMPSLAPSGAPSKPPTSLEFDQVAVTVQSLFGYDLADYDSSSPQYRAVEWMAEIDTALDDVTDPERFKQRYALVVLYYATGGDGTWINQASFLQPELHECDWFQPAPEGTQTEFGVMGFAQCTEQKNVTAIEFFENNLTGTLPHDLSALSDLPALFLGTNNLSGPLPLELFELSNLLGLFIPFNNFSGTLATEIGLLTSLSVLYLERTSLTGTIPSEIGLLTNLNQLGLASSSLTGKVPLELFELASLTTVVLGENQLEGQLPTNFPLNWPNLQIFSVWDNQLSGTIPTQLGSSSTLSFFHIMRNNFSGRLPESVVDLELMEFLDFSGNNFTGSLPSDWNRLPKLQYAFFRGNQLTGTTPASFGNLTQLQYLDVSANDLNGTIPPELGNLGSTLLFLSLQYNQLEGNVPSSLEQLRGWQILTLKDNLLVGDISFLCNGTRPLFPNIVELNADCVDEVTCPCCIECCDINNECVLQ